jgi:hypothetical protein
MNTLRFGRFEHFGYFGHWCIHVATRFANKCSFASRFNAGVVGIGVAVCLALGAANSPQAFAQGKLSEPGLHGNSQRSTVSQQIGAVRVTIDYSSPSVVSPQGEDRTGKIWGKVVPYGMSDLGFGPGGLKPWRAGADQNTTFTVSHDVLVQGQKLAAGVYGVHLVAESDESKKDWTLIFSKNSTAWGSYFYNPAEDVLRVAVKPEAAEMHQWLSYEFTERKPATATAALFWDKLKVPFRVDVPNAVQYNIDQMRRELQNETGFVSDPWTRAARYCAANNANLDEALTWAEYAVSAPFIGEKNFNTLSTKALVLQKLGKTADADAVMKQALPLGSAEQIYRYGRQLLEQKRSKEAMDVMTMNANKNPNTYFANIGLAYGHSAQGDFKQAAKLAKQALTQLPNPALKPRIEELVKKLESGKDIN